MIITDNTAPFKPEGVRALLFDLDDTLVLGSMAVKDQAWLKLFPRDHDKIILINKMFDKEIPFPDGTYHQGDRYDRIAYFLGLWSPESVAHREDREVKNLALEFKRLVGVGVVEIGVRAEDRTALLKLKTALPGVDFGVISNTPKEVLIHDLAAMGVAEFFDEVIGTPTNKVEALESFVKRLACVPNELVMIGDGSNDFQAAATVGTQFVGVIPSGKKDKWLEASFPKISTVSELPSLFIS